MTEQQQDPTPAPTRAAEKAADTGKTPKFAAYDKTFLKFVGGVHDTKAAATKAAKDAKVKDFEVREV